MDIKNYLKQKKMAIAAIALIFALLLGARAFAGSEPDRDGETSDTVAVEVKKVQYLESQSSLTYKTNLKPVEEAAVSAKVPGQVIRIEFENGDRVEVGQPLAYLDDEELQNRLKSAKLDLNKLQLALDSALRDYGNAKTLYEQGACSRMDYENAEQAYKTMQANVELRKVDIATITNAVEDSVIRAPISGEIGGKNLNIGQFVNSGTVIAAVRDNSSIRAEIQLMREDLNKISEGQEVSLRLDRDDTTAYGGTVKTIAASANSQTRAFDCLVEIDNRDGRLNSGTFGLIEIPDPEKRSILAVPMEAVIGSEGAYFVFTMEDNTARRVSVEIGEISTDTAEIVSGLKAGDLIITTNLSSLQDGDPVTVSGEGE